ncbi:hypothetical protein AVEN_54949-1 [Araneus ventricosus]|uniref:sn-1-specific diacylglycerol lipase ABHD11 n=1 Tax=Araneus ventricosus TaxID=182803 RepID=A0A4Y2HT14_ARAVE|nr:hypothetical protein AVEN_54949-1 [Araneus ventricosus]
MSSESSCKPVNLFFTLNKPEDGDDSKKCPIIFVHGFFSTNRTWNFVKYKIANKTKRKVYSLDLRNHGLSGYSEFFTSRHCMVDIENFMKSQNIPKAIFVAHSLGSRSVMDLALKKPELVEKLIVEDMTVTDTTDHPTNTKRLRLFTTFVDRCIRNAPADTSESDLHKKTLPMIKQFYPEISESFTSKIIALPLKKDKSGKITWDMNVEALFHYFDNLHLFQIDLSDQPKFLGKSLFLFGEKSPLKKEENEDVTLKYFPNAQFYIFKGGFHTFHLEFTELFIEVVSNFIEE